MLKAVDTVKPPDGPGFPRPGAVSAPGDWAPSHTRPTSGAQAAGRGHLFHPPGAGLRPHRPFEAFRFYLNQGPLTLQYCSLPQEGGAGQLKQRRIKLVRTVPEVPQGSPSATS